jgi:hypothetical protein
VQWERLGKPQLAKAIAPDPPHFPEELAYLWNWYRQHEMGLAINGMAPPNVTWEGVAAWSMITDVLLQPWEARAMVVLGYARTVASGEAIAAAAKQRSDDAAVSQIRPGGKSHRG